MRYHHVAVFVSDADESLKLFRDLLGFRVAVDRIIPDGPGDRTFLDQQTVDDIFHVQGGRSRMVLLTAAEGEGSFLELQQPEVPAVQSKDPETLRYGHTGISELAFEVTGIDEWFEKVRAAGYETQTDYVWNAAGMLRSFLFYDPDGNMIQLCENLVDPREAMGG